MGLGTGVGFVAGIDLVRAGLGGPFWQGAYGGSTMAAAGLALMVIPQLVGELGWRAPFWTGLVLALIGLLPVLAARRTTPTREAGDRGQPSRTVVRDRDLWPLAAVQMASFGLSVVAGNWIVTLLEREGHGRSVAGVVGGLILFAGIVTRPAGGLLLRRAPETGVGARRDGPRRRFDGCSRARGSTTTLVRGNRSARRRSLGRPSIRTGLQHDASPPARRTGRRDRIRERIGGSRHSRRHAARRPDLRHARGRPPRLPHHRPSLGGSTPRRSKGGAVVRYAHRRASSPRRRPWPSASASPFCPTRPTSASSSSWCSARRTDSSTAGRTIPTSSGRTRSRSSPSPPRRRRR